MKNTVIAPAPGPGAGTEALIREARRRHRKRKLIVGLAAVAVLASALGAFADRHGTSHPPPASEPRVKPAASHPAGRQAPGPIPRSLETTVLMWPVGYPLFTPSGGPPAYLDNLNDGRLVRHQIPGIAGGDFEPYAVSAGRWIVYVGNGTVAIRDDLKGKPRVLGKTPFFAKSATPGRVWLEYYRGGVLGQGPVSVRSVPVAGGRPGPARPGPARRSYCRRGPRWSRERTPGCCWRCGRAGTMAWHSGILVQHHVRCLIRRPGAMRSQPTPGWSPMAPDARSM